MARVALVTGGTRGIGAAISKALKDAGYKVAASYAGNDAAAEKFIYQTHSTLLTINARSRTGHFWFGRRCQKTGMISGL